MSTSRATRIADLAPELRSYLRARLGDRDADDVLQTVLVRALERADSLRSESALRGWVYQIAKNALVDQTRTNGRELPTDDLEPATEPEEEGACSCALSLTERLSPGQAELVRLVDTQDLSLREAAEVAGTSVGAATVKLHRARKRLREEIAELCNAQTFEAARACSCDSSHCS